MHSHSTDDEAPKDPGKYLPGFTEQDIEGHRAHTVFVGVHIPGSRRHSHRRHKSHQARNGEGGDKNLPETERPSIEIKGPPPIISRRRISLAPDDGDNFTPPAQRVQFILGEDIDDRQHESHPLFSEMETLVKEGDELEWKETARWIKFEEDVEEGGNRWSKPHVATLSLHSLFELRSLILNGSVILDMEANTIETLADLVCENMVNSGTLPRESRDKVREALLRRHRHQNENHLKKNMSMLPIIRSLAEIGRNHSSNKNLHHQARATSTHSLHGFDDRYSPQLSYYSQSYPEQHGFLSVPKPVDDHSASTPGLTPSSFALSSSINKSSGNNDNGNGKFLTVPGKITTSSLVPNPSEKMISSPSSQSMHRNTSDSNLNDQKHNLNFMRKIPPGAEASNILVGEVDFLEKTLSAFIRLRQATVMGNLTEVPVPTRFLFILLGPPGSHTSFHEIGRAMATLMSDEIFHEVAYRAKRRDHLLAGIDEFLDAVTVLPPGEWDPTIRIEPPAAIPSQEVRKRPPEKPKKEEEDEEEEEQRLREESGLSRTGRLFGGLINDVKRKAPWYFSDFKDALALQCIASWIFLYFACLSPIITFGGLLSSATGKNMAAMESLVSGFVCGIGYGFFSGQPLTILGSTGPVLVFETIVFEFCKGQGLDYMSFRFWIGTWIAIILLILVAIDASALVCYITRFTEENFATLIAFIFIYKAVENVLEIGKTAPIHPKQVYDCLCTPPHNGNGTELDWAKYNKEQCLFYNGTLVGKDCHLPLSANVFLMSIILFLGTFVTSIILKDFKNALFFPSAVRQFISDFSVIIAILSMTVLDFTIDVATPKLEVPSKFQPTLETRTWIIPPFNGNPFYTCIIAVFPALLGTILIFMDQQITAVIINRKENKLKKGCGYHLDLFILAILIQICSIMGLPWFVAATVLSINHVNSLKVESECAAPGEKPQFLGVREQRVTHILIFLMIGLSVLLTPLLCHIPMPVLYGVFLYMGVSSLKGLQFFDRILIMFMPIKYQPDYMFLRQVPIKRVHLFTIIQLACLAVLWIIKSFKQTSILFPLMLVVMIGIRKALDFVFTRRELKILDDIMPEIIKRQQHDDLHRLEDGTTEDNGHHVNNAYLASNSNIHIAVTLANGAITQTPINISEEVNKTTIWKQVNKDNQKAQYKLSNDYAGESGNKTVTSSSSTLATTATETISVPSSMKVQSSSELKKSSETTGTSQLSAMTEEDFEESSNFEDIDENSITDSQQYSTSNNTDLNN
ncbi:electrogenic sodium bicarbonate cotransporter 1 isoform X3 [Condylostylus longicornis]|nr:electrogenic sodium bicarbonate cotransporter 1 isoform X3 [Condylostylus longicornis]XP_055376646.1 electrogenic sodium bicarbonate cotransporter 1 isoform X3 [Condylostylus longicornis]XP_055376647.1 electrogenic sodium bicarbonate cotransporter 1 isoform X3 [Condylostylus longicornis]